MSGSNICRRRHRCSGSWTRVGLAALLLAFPALNGCGSEDAPVVSGDCEQGVLFSEREYVGLGEGPTPSAESAGMGTVARCEDTRRNSRGLIFDQTGERVPVFPVEGVPVRKAISIKRGGRGLVLVNREVPGAERRQIAGALDIAV